MYKALKKNFTKTNRSDSLLLLDKIFSLLDSLVDKFNCQKIKSTQNEYIAVCSTPQIGAHLIARLALESKEAVLFLLKSMQKDSCFGVKIGVACGPFCAGVVGTSKFLYDVFGDTINVSSRMMNLADNNSIQICSPLPSDFYAHFDIEERGVIHVKGKGKMQTYWLMGTRQNPCP